MTKDSRWKAHLFALSIVALVLLLGTVGANKMLSDPKAGPSRGSTVAIGELEGSSRACQTFVAEYDNLSQVQVRLADYGRHNTGHFVFHLRATRDAPQDLWTLTCDATEVRNNAYHAFKFPPILNSAGSAYSFCLEAPEAEPLNAITAIGTLRDTYSRGKASLRDLWGQSAGVQDLDFHLGYRLSTWDRLIVLSTRLSANKPLIFGERWFYALLGATYLTLLYLMLTRFVLEEDTERGPEIAQG